jgi:hypothetical protein
MQDIPDDPTGQLDKVEKFVEDNLDICKWVALGVLIVEVSGSCHSSPIASSSSVHSSMDDIGLESFRLIDVEALSCN